MAGRAEVNYSIRPNKSVERKLIFEQLRQLLPPMAARNYEYIGFGAFWFVDFVLAHRMLGISAMVSIERAHRAERANFNKPYKCIEVIGGDSSEVLPELSLEKPIVAWLDYQDSINGAVLEDVRILTGRVKGDSVIIVSLNAHKNSIARPEDGQNEVVFEGILRRLVGDLVPTDLARGSLTGASYPKVLASILLDHFAHCLRLSGRTEVFVPLFNFSYSDGAPMITVGGALAGEEMKSTLQQVGLLEQAREMGPEQIGINVPALTVREKSAIDKLLPSQAPPSREEVAELGFPLNEKEIRAYHRYYLQYPIYGEVDTL